jgi:hypothetical protein
MNRKCIVCGCTDRWGCEEGCSWISHEPPVCSSCVGAWMLAKLWAFVFALEGSANRTLAREVRELRTVYSFVTSDRAEGLGIPTLKQVCQINRNARKWEQQHQAVRKTGAR